MSIGENIKRLREKKGYSQGQLGEKVNVTQSMIAQIERGTKAPSLPLSMEIAKTLQCDIKELMEGIS